MNISLVSQLLIFIPITISIFIYIFNNERFNFIIFLSQFILNILAIVMWKYILNYGTLNIILGNWNRKIGIELKIDTLSMIFITMTIIIWWAVLLYSWNIKKKDFKFLFFLMFLEGSFIALLESNDFFTLFVLIELVTIISSILIIYKKDGKSVKSGLFYLLFNSFSMIIYLFGIVILYFKIGTLNMTSVKIALNNISLTNNSLIILSFTSFILAMFVKSAVLPVYEWLPRAHTAAPSYISALLSGLLVKTGVYGLIRILFIFNNNDIYIFLFYLGVFTSITGAIIAISQKDIKSILSFHTISQIGLIILALGINKDTSNLGAILHIFNHFIFKSMLFFAAGILINEYGVRRITEIRGVFKRYPLLSFSMIISILSITAFPFSIGYVSKTVIKSSLDTDFQIYIFKFISLFTIISFVKFSSIFFGKPPKLKNIPILKNITLIILALFSIILPFLEITISKFIFKNDILINISDSSYEKLNSKIFSFNFEIVEYFIMILIAYVIYEYFIKNDNKFLYKIRNIRINYQNAIFLLMTFYLLIIKILI